MKVILLLLIVFAILSCNEDCPDCPTQNQQNTNRGKLVLKSIPQNARIYLLGNGTGKQTPDSIENLEAGVYDVTLHLVHYDTAYFMATIFPNLTTTKEITLVDSLPPVEFVWGYLTVSDSVVFSFRINQDILMDSIVVDRPTNNFGKHITEKYTYNKELFLSEDQWTNPLTYYLPPSKTGRQYYPRFSKTYSINIYGQKAYGTQAYFNIFYQRSG